MNKPPLTLDEARAETYGRWAGNNEGYPYQEGRCAFRVFPDGWQSAQCARKAAYGPSNLYCKQHAAMVNSSSN